MAISDHSDEKKKVVHATLCAPGADVLRAFCVAQGVTVTAFLDGFSHALLQWQGASIADLEQVAPTLARALRHAREIDAGRRTREPRQLGHGGGGHGGGPSGMTVAPSSSSDTAHHAPRTIHTA